MSAICCALRSWYGRFWRVKISVDGPFLRCTAAPHATMDSTVSHGRQLSRLGIKRIDETCSTDWWVGPSSPRPIESWVNTKIERSFISGHAQRVAAVVGEGQEGGAERDVAAVQRDAVHDR